MNPRDTPTLAILAQFKTIVDSMSALKYLNIGNHSGHMLSDKQYDKQTLQRLFQQLTVNISPYEDQYPVEEDPCLVFKDEWTADRDSVSESSPSPNSTASTIPMDDFGL